MSKAQTSFAALRQSTGDDVAAILERMVRDAPLLALTCARSSDKAGKLMPK